jgi:hypothetical protein
MLRALVLICWAAVTSDLQDCTRENAMTLMRLPTEFSSPTACLMYGQATLANSSIGQELGERTESRLSARGTTRSTRLFRC